MIKLPINPLTPPIRVTVPKPVKQKSVAQKPRKSSVRPGGSAVRSGGKSPASVQKPDIPSFESLFQAMLTKYMPETVAFTPLSEEVLSETIRNWLRPAYEQAIQSRRDQTQQINADLDADAWSRGMGQSTYLTDVKERQYRGEAQDVDTLESNYAAELAGHLYDAIKEQQQMQIDVDRFNAEQINHAREQAMSAAQTLYSAYLSGSAGSRTTHRRADTTKTEPSGQEESFLNLLLGAQPNVPKTSYNSVVNALARMTPAERTRLYNRSDPGYLKLRSEILYSLGPEKFAELMRKFPGA